jgi:hypothetical protein
MNQIFNLPNRLWIFFFPICLGVLLFANMIHSTDYYMPDEYYQIVEFAGYKLGEIPKENLAWEFQEQSRQTIQPFLFYLMAKALNIIGISAHSSHILFSKLIVALFLLIGLSRYIHKTSLLLDKSNQFKYSIFGFLFWVIPCYYFRFSQEILAQICYLFIVEDLISNPKINFRKLGILTGFAFIIRFQSILSLFGVFFWLALNYIQIQNNIWKSIAQFAIGFLAMVSLGILVDCWFYDSFVLSFYNYFYIQIVEKIASGFGTQPVYFYLIYLSIVLSPFVLPIIGFSLFKYPKHSRQNLILWIVVFNFVILSMIGHKEERFLFPILIFIPFLFFKSIELLPHTYQGFIKRLLLPILMLGNMMILIISTLMNLQILTDQDKCFQYYVLDHCQKNNSIVLYAEDLHPFMDKVKVSKFKDTFTYNHNYIYKDVKFEKISEGSNIDSIVEKYTNVFLYLKKNRYNSIVLNKTHSKGSFHLILTSIPESLNNFLFQYFKLNIDKQTIYLVEYKKN